MVVVARLRASLEDQVRLLCCHAEQKDRSQTPKILDTKENVSQHFLA